MLPTKIRVSLRAPISIPERVVIKYTNLSECGIVCMERGNTREDSEFGGSVITQTFVPSV